MMRRQKKRPGALVYCDGAFGTTNGKTAHGLVRRSHRFHVLAVIDSSCAGADAGELLDGRACGIPVVRDLEEGLRVAESRGEGVRFWIVGLAPDGGGLSARARRHALRAIGRGLDVVSGLHHFLNEDLQMVAAARRHRVTLHDVRKPPPRASLHFFSGKIEEVSCLKVAVLGTDSAVGKRTTAWLLVDALERSGLKAELVGTGQTAWLQGARYGVMLDALINDFVSGEIEHAVWAAWRESRPDVLVIEGQGSLMNPAYPGGFEILAAARPEVVLLQHAPARRDYDGFPGYPIHPLKRQIEAIELISGRPVGAVTLNHEGLLPSAARAVKKEIRRSTGLVSCDPLRDGCGPLLDALVPYLARPGRAPVGAEV